MGPSENHLARLPPKSIAARHLQHSELMADRTYPREIRCAKPSLHFAATLHFIDGVSEALAPLIDTRRDTLGHVMPDRGFNPFRKEFLWAAPETTVKLLASLIVDTPAKSSFLDLPPELRVKIYEFVVADQWQSNLSLPAVYIPIRDRRQREIFTKLTFGSGFEQPWSELIIKPERLEPVILRACKLTRKEAMSVYQDLLIEKRGPTPVCGCHACLALNLPAGETESPFVGGTRINDFLHDFWVPESLLWAEYERQKRDSARDELERLRRHGLDKL
ncbi:hypothetical protein Slin15195_G119740 [Septoria linicola]|uniref:2EXR domain-containing protein n=1 Tax=Septoria linicola TaxID=215465 RepID=A0A9Q9B0Y9_9PEZI|nr:hypothetical protein Slin15195_G119740 [Septoria linicola]